MAQEAIYARLARMPPESRPLEQCLGQTLREDIYAERDNPPFDRVCMDGIAINSAALGRGQRRLRIEALQAAGSPAVTLGDPGNAIEVMTGAILPLGTDCVIPLEEYDIADGLVALKAGIAADAHRNVQRRGADSRPGEAMLLAGIRLGAPEIAVAASAGLARLNVSRQPTIMVVSTGDELIEPGRPIAAYQVRRSNAYAVVAALREHGLEKVGNDHIADDAGMMRNRLAAHLAVGDVLILSGGVSKGRFDLVPQALKDLGVREVFHHVAQRPGMPMWFGVGAQGQAVFGLPGNPVSTLICLIRYVVPAMRTILAAPPLTPEPVALAVSGTCGRAVTYFLPVCLRHEEDGRLTALPRPPHGSGDFLALAGTDGFAELPPRSAAFPAGFMVSLYRWRGA